MRQLTLVGLVIVLSGMGCKKRDVPKAPKTVPVQVESPKQSLSRQTDTKYAGDGPLKLAQVEKIAEHKGMVYEKQAWKFKGFEGIAWRVKVPRKEARLEVVASEDLTGFKSLLPKDSGWAAINGGFYERKTTGGYRPMGVVIASGKRFREYTYRGGSGILAVAKDHSMSLIHRKKWSEEKHKGWQHALQSIDRVVANKQMLVKPKEDARAATRSAVVLGEKYVWLIALAARQSIYPNDKGAPDGATLGKTSYLGLPLWAFAQYLKQSTDVVDALNLDGSVSTHFAVGWPKQKTHIQGVRGVFNALVLRTSRK